MSCKYCDCTGLTNVTIPNSVTSIGRSAFDGCSGLTSVTIPNSVTSIGRSAFDGCSGLTSVAIGNSVTSIGNRAFYGCSGLTSVTIPNSVTSIGEEAFYRCDGLTSVTIGNSVTSIGERAFYSYDGLTDLVWNAVSCSSMGDMPTANIERVTIGNNVEVLPSGFVSNSKITSVTIPNSVTSIGEEAFYRCDGLTDLVWNAVSCSSMGGMPTSNIERVTIGNNVEVLPSYFVSSSKITSVTIPNSVTLIGSNAFSGCSSLKSVTIPNSVTTIGGNAFAYSGLKSVTIGNSVTSISQYAFDDCIGLTDVVWNAKSCYYDTRPFKDCPNIISFTFGDEVEKIPAHLCYGMSKLTSVTIPNLVTSIGSSAFSGCSGLTDLAWNAVSCSSIGNMPTANIERVTIGNNVEVLPSGFVSNSKITSVTIPNSVTSIGSNAFKNCSGLTSVTIPNSVTSIGNNAFSDCIGLTSVIWNAKSCKDFNYSSSTDTRPFKNCLNISSFTFGDEVEKIPAHLCYGMSKLTSVTIPNSVTSIGSSAFSGCSGLTDLAWNAVSCSSIGNMPTANIERVTIGNNVEVLPSGFVSNSKITSVTIPNSVTSIGSNAFKNCSGLTSMTIPNSVTSIGEEAFYDCSGLTSVVWNAKSCGNFYYSSSNDTRPFKGCPNISSFTFGDEVEKIPAYLCYGMSKLTSVTIPKSVTTIGSSAFNGCSGLTSVTIPNSVTSIGSYAFYNCSGLKTVKSKVHDPQNITITSTYDLFSSNVYSNATLIVPPGSRTLYRNRSPWSNFHSIYDDINIKAICDTILHIRGEQTVTISVPINMTNEDAEVTAVQMDVTVPEIVQLVDVTLDASRKNGHTLEMQKLSSGKYRILVSSMTSKPLRGSDGPVLYFRISWPKRHASVGVYEIQVDNILLSSPNEDAYYAAGFSHPIQLRYLLGDANADATVDAADFVVTANRILCRNVTPYFSDAADVNVDNAVNVSDLVGITNIALGIKPQTICYAPAMPSTSNEAIANDDYSIASRVADGCILLDMANEKAIAGMQLDLTLPSGITLEAVEGVGRAQNMELQTAELPDGKMRLLLISFGNNNIAAGNGEVLKLKFSDNIGSSKDIDIVDALLTERDLTEHVPEVYISGIESSGVNEIHANATRVWTDYGCIVIECAKACTAQLVEIDGTSRLLQVYPGRNTYPTDRKGVVIITIDGKAVKVMRK